MINRKGKVLFGLLLVVALVCSLGGGYALGAGATASKNVYLDDLPASATYTIKTDGVNYWAVKYDGSISWSSTDAGTVITNCVGSNREVFLTAGTYSGHVQISGVSNFKLVGAEGAKIQMPVSTSYNVIEIVNSNFVTIENLEIDGAKASQTFASNNSRQHGICITASNDVTVDKNYIHDTVGVGVYVIESEAAPSSYHNIFVTNNNIKDNGLSTSPSRGGVYAYYTNDVYVTGNIFEYNYRVNVGFIGGTDFGGSGIIRAKNFVCSNNILNGTIDCGNDGNLLMYLVDGFTISNNQVLNAVTLTPIASGGTADGIRLENSLNGAVSNNYVTNNEIGMTCGGAGTSDATTLPNVGISANIITMNRGRGLYISNMRQTTVTGNVISDNNGTGLEVADYCNNTIVTGNVVLNNTAAFVHGGSSTYMLSNNNFGTGTASITEVYGSASVKNGEYINFTLTLANTPTTVQLSCPNVGVWVWPSSISTTRILVAIRQWTGTLSTPADPFTVYYYVKV